MASKGTIEWTNFPALRPDGLFTPNATGVIRIGSAAIIYRMTGLSLEPDGSGFRRFISSVQWWTDAPDYTWLAERFGIVNGIIDTSDGSLTSTVHDADPRLSRSSPLTPPHPNGSILLADCERMSACCLLSARRPTLGLRVRAVCTERT